MLQDLSFLGVKVGSVLPTPVLQFTGFGFSLLEGVDPNPDNLVGAGVVHTRSSQVGVLVRLELNMQAQVSKML